MATTTVHDTTVHDDHSAVDNDSTERIDGSGGEPVRVESRRDRVKLTREAGWRRVSFGSVITGVFVAFGAFALLLGLVSAVLDAVGVDTKALSDADWRSVGAGSAAALFVVLLLTYFYGGYVAGRMARRSGLLHGFLVFVFGALVLAAAAGIVYILDGTDSIRSRLHDLGAPTSGDQWIDIGSAAGVAGVLAMLFGAMFGGIRGERWHQKLLQRAADPTYGPEAADRAQAARREPEEKQVSEAAADSDDEPPKMVWSEAATPPSAPPERTDATADGGEAARDESEPGATVTTTSPTEADFTADASRPPAAASGPDSSRRGIRGWFRRERQLQ